MSYHVTLSRVNKRFGDVQAVNDVSLQINRGELVTLLGPSGCGKTTTLHMLAGFLQPDSGEIRLGDEEITFLPSYRRKTPMVFQEYALFPHLSVFENIAYGLKLRKKMGNIHRIFQRNSLREFHRQTIRNKVANILDDLGLPSQTMDRFPSQLSGGQQQRIALARALVLDPEVLLLDEPLSNLDAKLRVKVRYEIKELRKRFNITVIFVTHDQEEALSISDKIAVMNKGVVEQFGEPAEIYYRPKSEFVAGFIGETNFLDVKITNLREAVGKFQVFLEWRNRNFQVFSSRNDLRKGQQRKLLLRPEAINLFRSDQINLSDAQAERYIPGKIKRNSFLGTIMRYWVDVGGQEIVVDDAKMMKNGIFAGEIWLAFHDQQLHFV